MLEFILDRYNYWIFIVLMMMGLYIVISRGNLVKKIIGLNVFQTSVFIFYISIGKITGGTAPIYLYKDYKARTDHSGEHGGGHDEAGVETHGTTVHGGEGAAHSAETDPSLHEGLGANPVDVGAGESGSAADKISNDLHHADAANNTLTLQEKEQGFEIDHADGADPVGHVTDAAHAVSDVIYTNPLPHVLILTAIVVGVATTAVGLALAVRIREAYGTIEEDELEADDHIAEFGDQTGAAA